MELSNFPCDSTGQNQQCNTPRPSIKKKIRHIDLLLVGKTGHGKSSTGNTILDRTYFEATSSTSSVTKTVQYEVRAYKNYVIKVVDTPGVADTAEIYNPVKASQIVIDQMKDAVILNPDGYHAFLLVLKFGLRFTKEVYDCIRILKQIFGDYFVKRYCILVITGGDLFYENEKKERGVSFKQWIKDQKGDFKNLVEECANRVVLFDNKTQDSNLKLKQMSKLLKDLDKINLNTNGVRYTDHHFRLADESRKKLIEEKRDILIVNDLNEISMILEKLLAISSSDEEKRAGKLAKLLSQTQNLISKLNPQDDSDDNEHEVISLIKNILESIQIFSKKMDELICKLKQNEIKINGEAEILSITMTKYMETRKSVKQNLETVRDKIQILNRSIDSLEKEREAEMLKIKENQSTEINGQMSTSIKEFDDKIEKCKEEKIVWKNRAKEEKLKEINVKELLAKHFQGEVKMKELVDEENTMKKQKQRLEFDLRQKVDRNKSSYHYFKNRTNVTLKESSSCSIL